MEINRLKPFPFNIHHKILSKYMDHQDRSILHRTQKSLQNDMHYPCQSYIPTECHFHLILYCSTEPPELI